MTDSKINGPRSRGDSVLHWDFKGKSFDELLTCVYVGLSLLLLSAIDLFWQMFNGGLSESDSRFDGWCVCKHGTREPLGQETKLGEVEADNPG